MATDTERNKQIVLDFLDAFTTFDAERYEPFLAEDPVYQVGMTVHQGRAGFADVARFGRILYPNGQDRRTVRYVAAEGDVVAMLVTIDATTNSGASYTNDYALFFVLEHGKIKLQVEILDFRVSADKFDLSALG